ncbi:MAG: ABC transporter substrate-binding protein [Bacillota bacterium]|nr:ABC transporter substrate-binding protein [Bacillota bacterium]
MKRNLAAACALCLLIALLCTGCGGGDVVIEGESTVYSDSSGRDVEIPVEVERVAPSGAVAQMILATLVPEKLCGLASTPGSTQMKYFPESFLDLPTFGQLYGSKSTLNIESLLTADAQLIIDLGDKKNGHAADMNTVQRQTGVPTIFIETTLEKFPAAYRDLGKILDKEEEAEEMALFIERTLAMAQENRAKIPEEERVSVMYGSGTSGLNCNARGSVQADVIEYIGAVNAVYVNIEELSNSGGGNTINMEQLYIFDPDYIILTGGGPYAGLAEDSVWDDLTAVQADHFYEIPMEPYNWMGNPPSINRVLGIWWLGNLLYPEIYDYDMVEIAREFYRLFYRYELTVEEAEAMLANSSLKVRQQQEQQ